MRLSVKQIEEKVLPLFSQYTPLSIEGGKLVTGKRSYRLKLSDVEIYHGLPDYLLLGANWQWLEIKTKNDYLSARQKVVFSILEGYGHTVNLAMDTGKGISIVRFKPISMPFPELVSLYKSGRV